MRSLWLIVAVYVFVQVGSTSSLRAGDSEGLRFGPYIGPSFPSDQLGNVYNIATESGEGDAYEFASSLGFHVGGRIRYGLSENFSLAGGISYHRFPNQELTFTSESGATLQIKNVSNIIPINAGLIFRMPLAAIVPYIGAGAVYVHQNVTMSEGDGVFSQIFSNGQEIEPTTNRMGADVSLGIGFNLVVVSPFIEFRQTWSNLIGKEDNEQTKSFMSLSVGLLF